MKEDSKCQNNVLIHNSKYWYITTAHHCWGPHRSFGKHEHKGLISGEQSVFIFFCFFFSEKQWNKLCFVGNWDTHDFFKMTSLLFFTSSKFYWFRKCIDLFFFKSSYLYIECNFRSDNYEASTESQSHCMYFLGTRQLILGNRRNNNNFGEQVHLLRANKGNRYPNPGRASLLSLNFKVSRCSRALLAEILYNSD